MSRKKEKLEKIKKEIVNIRKDDKQARVLVILTSVLFAAIATLFYIVDWTLDWGWIKIVSCIIVDIWLFFLPPSIRLSYLRNEGKSPGQWFMMGYHAGASGLWMPVLLAPLFGILYFLPRTYKKKGGDASEETADGSDVEERQKENGEAQTDVKAEEKIAVASAVPAVAEAEKPKAENPPVSAEEGNPKTETPVVLPKEEKEEIPAPSEKQETKEEAVPTPPVQPEVRVVPIIISPMPHETPADETKKED